MPQDIDHFIEEAIPLIAEDLKSARTRLSITSARAAKHIGISWSRYRHLETGRVCRSQRSLAAMLSAADRLGLQSVRMSYLELVGQYIHLGLTKNEPLTIFIDVLQSNIAKLKEQGHFVSPHLLLEFVDREGLGEMLDSRKAVDKSIIELWITAIYTLCLDHNHDYYVRALQDDPPDTEVLRVDNTSTFMSRKRVEITQHGPHSASLTDVVGKKLKKRYQKDTILLVLVDKQESIHVPTFHEFIEKNNPHQQEVAIIGGAEGTGTFKVIPWKAVTTSTRQEKAWMKWREIVVHTKDQAKVHSKYDGVVVQPPFMSTCRPSFPVFVKTVSLRR